MLAWLDTQPATTIYRALGTINGCESGGGFALFFLEPAILLRLVGARSGGLTLAW